MDAEEEIHFETTSLDYAQQLADIQEDLHKIDPDQIDDYIQNILESPLIEKENRIIYLSKVFIQSAKSNPGNIENLALLTKRLVDKLYEISDEKGNTFFTALLSHLRDPFELYDSGCFFYRQLINNEVMSISDVFSEIDSIEINQKIVDELSFDSKSPEHLNRNKFIKKITEEEDGNYELYRIYGFINSSSCLDVDCVDASEKILIKSGLMKWLADYIYEEFPGTISKYLDEFNISFPSRLEDYKKQANEAVNDDNLCVIIRNDDVDALKQIVVNNIKFNLNQTIKQYRFERNPALNGKTTLLEYSIYYNSMKVFKYIFLNLEKQFFLSNNPKIEEKAILGDNIECVRLLDQSNYISIESLFYSVKSFETDIFVWLYQNKYPNGYFNKKSNLSVTWEILDSCIKYENLPILLFLLVDEGIDINLKDKNGNSLLYLCAKYDRRLIARFLMLNDKFKINTENFIQVIYSAIEFNNAKIFSSFLKMNQNQTKPYLSSILSNIYKCNSTECFGAAIKIIPYENIRKDKQLATFLSSNYTGEMITKFLDDPLYCKFFYTIDVLKQLCDRKDYQTFIAIINKTFHDHETQLKFSINATEYPGIQDDLREILKGYKIPHYYIADKLQKDAFELMIGELMSNVCIQVFRNMKPKFKDILP